MADQYKDEREESRQRDDGIRISKELDEGMGRDLVRATL